MRLVIQTFDIAPKFTDIAQSDRADKLAQSLGGTVDQSKLVPMPWETDRGIKELGGAHVSQISVADYGTDYEALMQKFIAQGYFIADMREFPNDGVIKFQLTTNEDASLQSRFLQDPNNPGNMDAVFAMMNDQKAAAAALIDSYHPDGVSGNSIRIGLEVTEVSDTLLGAAHSPRTRALASELKGILYHMGAVESGPLNKDGQPSGKTTSGIAVLNMPFEDVANVLGPILHRSGFQMLDSWDSDNGQKLNIVLSNDPSAAPKHAEGYSVTFQPTDTTQAQQSAVLATNPALVSAVASKQTLRPFSALSEPGNLTLAFTNPAPAVQRAASELKDRPVRAAPPAPKA